jgi:hypothetical protein
MPNLTMITNKNTDGFYYSAIKTEADFKKRRDEFYQKIMKQVETNVVSLVITSLQNIEKDIRPKEAKLQKLIQDRKQLNRPNITRVQKVKASRNVSKQSRTIMPLLSKLQSYAYYHLPSSQTSRYTQITYELRSAYVRTLITDNQACFLANFYEGSGTRAENLIKIIDIIFKNNPNLKQDLIKLIPNIDTYILRSIGLDSPTGIQKIKDYILQDPEWQYNSTKEMTNIAI